MVAVACGLTDHDIEQAVIDAIKEFLNTHYNVTRKTRFFDDLFLTADGQGQLYDPCLHSVALLVAQSDGCNLRPPAREEFEDTDTVGDAIDVFVAAVNLEAV